MFFKRPRYRVFDYPPRFYKPEQDETERRKRKLGFTSQRKYKARRRSPAIWILFIIIALYIYLKLQGIV